MSEPPTLLVLRPLGLGDFLTGIPAYRALQRAFPEHRRVLAAPAALAPLAALTGAFHATLAAAPLCSLREAPARPDVAVNLHGRGPQSHRVLLELRPRRLLAFSHREVPESQSGFAWRADEHEVLRWCRMLLGHGIASDPGDLELELQQGSGSARGYLLLHPGAASAARRWPAARWARVARRQRIHDRVVLSGGPDEVELVWEVARRAGIPPRDVHAGDLDVVQLAALVRGASTVVCGDTGVAHLATALRRPSVLLFGPTPPSHWGPPPGRRWHRVLWSGAEGCAHADRTDPGLLAIQIDDVIEELGALAASLAPAPLPAAARQEHSA